MGLGGGDMTQIRKGPLKRHELNSHRQSAGSYPEMIGPISKAHPFAREGMGYPSRMASVSRLLSMRCPSDISGRIVAFVVNTVERAIYWSLSKVRHHPVSEKGEVFSPPLGHGDASTSIVTPLPVVGVVTPGLYAFPFLIERSPCPSVLGDHGKKLIRTFAPSATCAFAINEMVRVNLLHYPTVAFAQRHDDGSYCPARANDLPSSKSFTSPKREYGHGYTISNGVGGFNGP